MTRLPPAPLVRRIVEAALAEDLAGGDPTTEALVPPDRTARAVIVAKVDGVLCGGPIARAVFAAIDPSVTIHLPSPDGATVAAEAVVEKQ